MDIDDTSSLCSIFTDDQLDSPDTAISEETICRVTETIVASWPDINDEFTAVDSITMFSESNDCDDWTLPEPVTPHGTEGDVLTAVDPTTVFPDVQPITRWEHTDKVAPGSPADCGSETSAKRVHDKKDNSGAPKPKRKRLGHKFQTKQTQAQSENSQGTMPKELINYLNLAPANAPYAPQHSVPIHVGTGQSRPIDYSKILDAAKKNFGKVPFARCPPLLNPLPKRIQAHFPRHQPSSFPQKQQYVPVPNALPNHHILTVPITPQLNLQIPVTAETLQQMALTNALPPEPVQYFQPAVQLSPPLPKPVQQQSKHPTVSAFSNPVVLATNSINNRYGSVGDEPTTPTPSEEIKSPPPLASTIEYNLPTPFSPMPVTSPGSVKMEENETGHVYRCEECYKSFKHKLSLTNHQRSHGIRQPHVCFICKEPFKYKTNLKRHLRIHARQMRMCKYCHSILDSDYGLVQHEKEHRQVMAGKEAMEIAAELESAMLSASIVHIKQEGE